MALFGLSMISPRPRKFDDNLGEYEDVISMPPRCFCERNVTGHSFDSDMCDRFVGTERRPAGPVGVAEPSPVPSQAVTPPLSVPTLVELVRSISYKSGWLFAVETYDQYTGPFLVIRAYTVNSRDPEGDEVALVVRSMIPPMGDAERFISWVLWRVTQMEIHETQEFFKVDGVVFLDPHRELGA